MPPRKKSPEHLELVAVASPIGTAKRTRVNDQNILGNVVLSMGAFFNTELTLDEEKTVAAILKMWSRDDSSAAYRLAGQLADLTDGLNGTNGEAWSSAVAKLLDQIYKAQGGDIFISWTAGLQLRANCAADSMSAAEEREMLTRTRSSEPQIAKLSSQLAVIEAKNEKLQSQKEALEESVEAQRKALKAAQILIEEATFPTVSGEDQDAILGILECQDSSTILIGDRMTAKKLVNARNGCEVSNSDVILGLIDLTFFGSAKKAILFGTESFYFLEDDSPVHFAYSELRRFKMSLSDQGLKFSKKSEKFIIDCTVGTARVVKDVLEQIEAALS